ncbi:LOG family protein [Nitratireductor sp. XY-223]|uniref:LOG family protein n=1 Tax=Nitratireductor sp. XY-223 TaxID=2561926 RepID=UPI0010AA13BA|nr:LOG family protein [Nitratireductor sp. XY-223]
MGAKRSDEVWDPLFDNRTDRRRAAEVPQTPQTEAPAYRLAFADDDFLCREELRPVRLQLELLKPEILLSERGIRSTVVMFGGARIPAPGTKAWAARNETQQRNLTAASKYYEEARKFARICSRHSAETGNREFVIVTGGGPGVMEAGNLGASEEDAPSIGLNIILPHEQAPNEHVTPELCFNFHYFAVRKMHFLMRAKAISVFPGGFGTLDEMFEALTLIQTGRMEPLPFILFGADFWHKVIDFQELADFGTISPDDLKLFNFVETADEAWDIIASHYGL